MGLIMFKILKLFLEVKAATGDTTTYQHIIFVIIESGMFVIQLVHMVLYAILVPSHPLRLLPHALKYVIVIGEMFNVIIRSICFYFFCFTEKNHMARASHQQ